MYLYLVSLTEVVDHVSSDFLISLIEDVVLGVHVPLDLMNFIATVWTILSHYYCPFKFSINEICVVSLESIIN